MTGTDPADPATRIAMWSGPRTVSTALMRSWENRPDTVVVDEPLYAFYLDRTGLDHPGRDAVIASQPTDWRVVLADLSRGPLAIAWLAPARVGQVPARSSRCNGRVGRNTTSHGAPL